MCQCCGPGFDFLRILDLARSLGKLIQQMIQRVAYYAAAVVVAVALGLGSAWWAINRPFPSIQNGAWQHDSLTGSAAANPYLRARVARFALLALNSSEALYFFATTDDRGDPLQCNTTYRVEGKDLDARWWSITVYGADDFLIPNEQNRYSYNMSNLARNPDGSYRVCCSCSPKPGNWLPTGKGETFILALRLFNPGAAVRDRLATIDLPRIVREGRDNE
jgi:hypothetical protein